MKGIDHLVLCGRDLRSMRARYAALGFTLTPEARHPFGTGNSLVQLDGAFLELLAVVDPALITEPQPGLFSFGAFARDFLARREGMGLLVLDSADARADVANFTASGLQTYTPVDFSRQAKLPTGQEVTVGFSLAFATHADAPEAGFFCCQQHAPQYFWKPEYQRHANGAFAVEDVFLVADRTGESREFLRRFAGVEPVEANEALSFETARGSVEVVTPAAFAAEFGAGAPDGEGPRFAGFTIAVGSLATAAPFLVEARERGDALVVAPAHAFGVAIRFRERAAP